MNKPLRPRTVLLSLFATVVVASVVVSYGIQYREAGVMSGGAPYVPQASTTAPQVGIVASSSHPSTSTSSAIIVIASTTHEFPVYPPITFNDAYQSQYSIPDILTLNNVSVTTSSFLNGGLAESDTVLSLGFNVLSGAKNSPSPASANSQMVFCTQGLNSTIRLLYDEKGDTLPGNFVQPANECVGSFINIDNVQVGYDIPGPGSYTFVVGASSTVPSFITTASTTATTSTALANFTVTLSASDTVSVQGFSTQD